MSVLPPRLTDPAGERLTRRLDQIDWDFPSFVPRASTKGIHSLHWYPAPFPPALPATLLDVLGGPNQALLDPFCGSGVSLLEGWMRGYRTFGIDVNHFALELISAKSELLLRGSSRLASDLVSDYAEYRKKELGWWTALSGEEVVDHAGMDLDAKNWFESAVLSEIGLALAWIAGQASEDRSWLWIALSSVLHKSSMVRHVHYTYIVDRSRTKTAPPNPVSFHTFFTDRVVRACRDASTVRHELSTAGRDLRDTPRPELVRASAADISGLALGRFDLVITSPPYFGMNDYVRSQYLSWLIRPWTSFSKDLLRESGSRRSRRSQDALRDYLNSMGTAISEAGQLLRPGGYLCIVIGASRSGLSALADPVTSLRSQLEASSGLEVVWEGERQGGNRKVNNSPRCREQIWVFRK